MTFDTIDAVLVYFLEGILFTGAASLFLWHFFWYWAAVKRHLRKLAEENGFEFDPIAW